MPEITALPFPFPWQPGRLALVVIAGCGGLWMLRRGPHVTQRA